MFLLLLFIPGPLSAQSAVSAPHTVSVQPLNVPPELGLRELPDEDVKYHGVIQSQDQLDALWKLQENIMTDLPTLLSWMIPAPPDIDFKRYTVLWYSNRGARASFVELQNVVEDNDSVKVNIRVTHSDFGSSRLNLWRIPKTDKPVILKETHLYDRASPGGNGKQTQGGEHGIKKPTQFPNVGRPPRTRGP